MHRKGHLGITMMFSAPIIVVFALPTAALLVVPMFILERVPDKDQHLEWVPGINHRGITHTLLFAIFCGVIASTAVIVLQDVVWAAILSDTTGVTKAGLNWPKISSLVGVGAFLGIFSHIMGDVITVGSKRYDVLITPYWPLTKRAVRFGWCYAANTRWNWGLFILGVVLSGAALLIRLQLMMSNSSQTSLSLLTPLRGMLF